jgi:hypothetical protein
MKTEKNNEGLAAQSRSEVARLRHQIAQEYEAAARGLIGLAQGTAQHRFITTRMERIADHHQSLTHLVGAQEATRIVGELALDMEQPPQEEVVS